jgi:hypothetical protein
MTHLLDKQATRYCYLFCANIMDIQFCIKRQQRTKQTSSVLSSNNNNQVFYSQASWGRLEMKPHEPKNRDKTRAKKPH